LKSDNFIRASFIFILQLGKRILHLVVVEMSSNVRLETKGFEIERLNYLNTSSSNKGHMAFATFNMAKGIWDELTLCSHILKTSLNPVPNAQVCVYLTVHITKLQLQTTFPKPLYIPHSVELLVVKGLPKLPKHYHVAQ